MLLLAFGPFTLETERREDDESKTSIADFEVSTACMLFIHLSLFLSFIRVGCLNGNDLNY